jgi:hypothetical protein
MSLEIVRSLPYARASRPLPRCGSQFDNPPFYDAGSL